MCYNMNVKWLFQILKRKYTLNFAVTSESNLDVDLMNKYFDEIWSGNCLKPRGYFINVGDLLLEFKLSINANKNMDKWRSRFQEIDLIVWDDIGDVPLTGYEHQILYSLINKRLANGKANIYTSNAVGETLKDMVGSRLYSRIYNNSEVIELVGPDMRGVE